MIHLIPRSRLLTQTLLLACFTFVLLFAAHQITYSLVLKVYIAGGDSFRHSLNPYDYTLENFGAHNQFKYSPFAAIMYYGLYKVKFANAVIGIWAFASLFTFSLGLSLWADLTKKYPLYVTLAFFACLGEAIISQSVHQTNCLIIGLTLIGLAAYRQKKYFASGNALLIAANIKVMPIIFLAALAPRFKLKFFYGIAAAGLLTFLIPALFVGWNHNWEMHLAWVNLVLGDTTNKGLLDAQSTLARMELALLGNIIKYTILSLSIPIFFTATFFLTPRSWVPWLTLGTSALLLLSPRTDIFTYAILAPSYLLLAIWFAECEQKIVRVAGGWLTTVVAASMGIGLSIYGLGDEYSNSFLPAQRIRIIGALYFWLISCAILVHQLTVNIRQRLSSTRFASVEHS
ncbi:MAG: glycosyltransferase 87 family protein [Verrucomicrobiota bacterium]